MVEQDVNMNFLVKVTCFLSFSPASLAKSCSFWYAYQPAKDGVNFKLLNTYSNKLGSKE